MSNNEWHPGYLSSRGLAAGDVPPVPEPGTDMVFAGLSAKVMRTDTSGPYPRTQIQYWATGTREWVPTDGLRSPGPGITLSRFQLEEWAGYPLTDEQVTRLADSIGKSSIPDAINEIAFAITGGRPELDGEDHCG